MELKALDTYIAIERDVLRYDGSIHSVECLFIEPSELEMYLNEGWRLKCFPQQNFTCIKYHTML